MKDLVTYDVKRASIVLAKTVEYYGQTLDVFQVKGRPRGLSDMRFIAARLLKKYVYGITQKETVVLLGRTNHTTIGNALVRAQELLDSKDEAFTTAYNSIELEVKKAINEAYPTALYYIQPNYLNNGSVD